MKSRTVNRNQKAQYASGSRAKGFYTYTIQGLPRIGASRQYFDIEGDPKPESKDAIQAAWTAARTWVAEIGEVAKTDSEYSATA